MVGAGLWLQTPYLTIEHQRLETWKVIEIWGASILAALWFVRFTFVHAICGEPLTEVPKDDGQRQIRAVAITGATVVVLELALTAHLMLDEHERYKQGIVVEARITGVRETKRELATWYEVDCAFQDKENRPLKAHVRIEAKNHVVPSVLAPETADALYAHRGKDMPLRIRYDPEFPARAWVNGLGWDDGNRIYWFSLLTLLFQAGLTALFLLFLVKYRTGDFLPWWCDIYKVLPLLAGSFWMLVMGLIDLLMDSLG